MCGILVSKKELTNQERLNSISHRGIEMNVRENKNWFFCHHRLPIQTVEGDSWSQPISLGHDKFLLFNGEIFNYPPEYSSDVEYLKDIFKNPEINKASWFSSFYSSKINSWDGFWAIVIYDEISEEVICFTDPLGKKQLYYNEIGEICSEVKGLINDKSSINYEFISSVKKFGYNHNNQTAYNGVYRILPNNIYSWDLRHPNHQEVSISYNRDLKNKIDIPGSYEERTKWLRDSLVNSTRRRLISKNYPISVLLSGGLDSTIITSILENIGAKVNYFTIENGEDDEYVKECEKFFGINVTRLKYSMDLLFGEYSDEIQGIYRKWNESPIDLGSVIPQYWLFDAVKKQTGFRIVISGDGADELFGGYRRINQYDSQMSDVFTELTYYHLPRLDRMSMAHTLELRNPFLDLDIVRFAISLPLEERTNKKILKDAFKGLIPQSIIDRSKLALKNEEIKTNPDEYRDKAISLFLTNPDIYLKKPS
jgi:asparagine synthase (glutamine-hydrolysing)